MNRGHGLQCVAVQNGIAVDRPVFGAANAVISGRKWEYFDFVFDLLHAFNLLDHVLGVGLQRGPRHLAIKLDVVPIDPVFEIVENAVKGQQPQLVPNLLYQVRPTSGLAVAFVFRGTELSEVVSTTQTGRGYRIARGADGRAIETELPTRYLG